MTVLVDTSILGRLANTDDSSHSVAGAAVLRLRRQGETLLTAPQNLIEFRNFATRPVSANGLGLSVPEAEVKGNEFESLFGIAPDTSDIYQAWKSLAGASAATGKQVHDVRLIAICQVHGIDRPELAGDAATPFQGGVMFAAKGTSRRRRQGHQPPRPSRITTSARRR